MNAVETAYQAWADYMDNAPLADVFTDAYHNRLMALWMAYVSALGGASAIKAYSDLVALKTPQIASETEIDPAPAAVEQTRYTGVINRTAQYIHCHQLRRDFAFNPDDVLGFPASLVESGLRVEFSISVSWKAALNIVVIGAQSSEAAYQAKIATPQKVTPVINPRSKIIRETLYQKAQRLEREAAQRAQARKEAHQPQDTRVTFGNEAGYTMDGPASDYDNIDMAF